MKALLVFDDWIKKIEVESYIIKAGYVRVAFYPPMSHMLPNEGGFVCNEQVKEAEFIYSRTNSNGVAIFEYARR